MALTFIGMIMTFILGICLGIVLVGSRTITPSQAAKVLQRRKHANKKALSNAGSAREIVSNNGE